MKEKINLRFSKVFLTGAIWVPLMLIGCQTSDEETKIYPISSGRYYAASELASTTRDSALSFEDFKAGGIWVESTPIGPGRTTELDSGTWYCGEASKTLNRQFKGSNNLQTDYIRNITDTSFQTCDNHSRQICFEECSGPVSQDPGNGCYHYTEVDTASLWVSYIK